MVNLNFSANFTHVNIRIKLSTISRFIAGPGFTLIANSLIDKWIRESVVYGVCHFIAIIGHLLFFVSVPLFSQFTIRVHLKISNLQLLTVPSKANKNFPYHVRTSQIGVMEMTGIAGNSSLYNFGHHSYAPYATPSSLIDTERSHIRTPNVPVDLFSIHPSSNEVGLK